MNRARSRVRELYKTRPRDRFLRMNVLGLVVLITISLWHLNLQWSDLFSETRSANLKRFAAEVYPYELRNREFEWSVLVQWLARIWSERGSEAMATTFSISVVAIIFAGLAAVVFIIPASRNIATSEPFLPAGGQPTALQHGWWKLVVSFVRISLIVVRSIPEYIWAFLFIAMLGPSAWPAILALAVHNLGILGKLGAEVVENLNPSPLRALRAQGLSRTQIAAVGVIPASLPKWLLFFFYRWESCIREATVLGMLGITSLGYWVREARARDWYDEMLLFILMGALLVLIVDLASALTRRYLRRA